LDVALKTKAQLGLGDHYNIRGFLQGSDMASALAQALLVVCRSGAGTLAELATFRKPSVLVPYPLAFGDHQRFNALEFVDMGAATILEQSNLQPSSLESEISSWLDSANRQGTVSQALAAWDIPDATTRVLDLLLEH
jgi:UDP-N-acetylglucosamine--N-acetylmuramyl-(pentapeptide) pyrophosphoryl-undecaprenol N-acetylglucosamine transferase